MKRVLTIILVVSIFCSLTTTIADSSSFDFKYENVVQNWNVTKEEFDAEQKEVQHPISYIDQFSAIVQMVEWTTVPTTHSAWVAWRVVIFEEELQRMKSFIEGLEPSEKNAEKVATTLYDMWYFYDCMYRVYFPQLGEMTTALSDDNAEVQNFSLEALDAEHLTPNSLKWLDREVEGIRTILSFTTKTVSDWDTVKNTTEKLLALLEVRHVFFKNYFRENLNVVFPDHIDYPIPTWKLGS